MFDEILKLTRRWCYVSDQFGGPINITTRSPIDALFEMQANYKKWNTILEPFNKYVDRCEHRVMRELGDKIIVNFNDRWIQSQEELEKAIADGAKWTGKHQMVRTSVESTLELKRLRGITRVFPFEERQLPRGCPYANKMTMFQVSCIMRHLYNWMFPAGAERPIAEALPYIRLNQKLVRRVARLQGLNPFVREMVYAFYNENRRPDFWVHLNGLRLFCHIPDDTEILAQMTARLLEDALGFDYFKQEWKTDTVRAMCRTMYHNDAFDGRVILADALQDAGCDNELLLSHLRNSMTEMSLGSWIFRVMGKL